MENLNLDNELPWATHLEELFFRIAKSKQGSIQGGL